jgi:hypothetical protein
MAGIMNTPQPKRIQRQRTKGWRMPEGALYVGRPSRWGNPFRIYHGHSIIGPMWHIAAATWGHIPTIECVYGYVTSSSPLSTRGAVSLYASLLEVRARVEPDRLADWLAPLRGKDLACWCPPDLPCHADVLLNLANVEGGAANA